MEIYDIEKVRGIYINTYIYFNNFPSSWNSVKYNNEGSRANTAYSQHSLRSAANNRNV